MPCGAADGIALRLTASDADLHARLKPEPAVERFFTNRLDATAHPYFEQIAAARFAVNDRVKVVTNDGVEVGLLTELDRS